MEKRNVKYSLAREYLSHPGTLISKTSSLEETSTASKKNDPEIQVWLDLVNAEKGKAPETTGTKILDQVRIDNAIRDFKNRLSSKYAKDMFDTLLLSSFRVFP